MKRLTETRPSGRCECDLRECHERLSPRGEYPTLREGRYFAGVRVFCTLDHREEYEMRLVLANTKPRYAREDQVPGVRYPSNERTR